MVSKACSYSNNSVCFSCDLFEVMFPDSKIASQVELSRIKLMYVVNFGIAPYFYKILKNETVILSGTQLVLMKVLIKWCKN